MDKARVSILVPAFNVAPYLDECLCSLKRQTLKEIEVIVVDDGSSGDTWGIAESYARTDKRFRAYHQPHAGVSAARNACLSYATGEYIGFVDGDDTVSSDAFEQLCSCADRYAADVVLGSILYCYEDGSTCRIGEKPGVFFSGQEVLTGKQGFKAMMETGSYVPMVCGNLYRTAFVRDNSLHFEGAFHEDEYFTPYALFYAERVTGFKGDFYFYRQRNGSIMHDAGNIRQRADSLWTIGDKLRKFARKIACQDGDIADVYDAYAVYLHTRAQRLYERELAQSRRKCLFIFSESGIGAQYGVGTYISQLTGCFSLSEWDVNVVTLQTREREVGWKMENGVAYYDIPLPCEMWNMGSASYTEKYSRSVFYYLSVRMPHARSVYCHFNFFGYDGLAAWCKEKWQAKIFFTLHYTNWSFDLLGDVEWLKRILASPCGEKEKNVVRKFRLEKEFMIGCCDRIIAIAPHSYAMLRELYGVAEEKLAFVPNGMKDEYKERSLEECKALRSKYGFTEKDKLIVFAGRLDPVKGVSELIEAFKLLRKERNDIRLIIAGSGNFTRCLDAANPDWAYVMLTGFISKEQLYELYAIADVGVVPSIHEEFGYVALEMMMNKLPVVVNATTGLREMTENGRYGRTFHFGNERNVENLKEALDDVLREETDGKLLAAGRNRALRYSIGAFRKRINEVYDYKKAERHNV